MPSNPASSLTTSLGTTCAICSGDTEPVLYLPALPLTDTFTREPVNDPIAGIDQTFRFCQSCHHGQLESHVLPDILYGGNYCFRTSASPTARKGTDFFFSVVDRVASARRFRCAVDLGCNDLFLLNRLGDRAQVRVGVDPLWSGREHEMEGQPIQVIGTGIEEADLSALPQKPDLVVCRHTLEHIARPMEVVQRMLKDAADDALFIFEVPGLEALVNRQRFDQVFHQHLQYFTMTSFLKMLRAAGATPVALQSNYHDWGAFAVAFVGGGDGRSIDVLERPPEGDKVKTNIDLFQAQMNTTRQTLLSLDGPIFGYGAAQMLPVLAYHMKTDLAFLRAVLDDDPEKEGVRYWNLPVEIKPSSKIDGLADASVLITAVDNVKPIMRRLLENRPKHIICPFNTI